MAGPGRPMVEHFNHDNFSRIGHLEFECLNDDVRGGGYKEGLLAG